jgi:hypothetical protein
MPNIERLKMIQTVIDRMAHKSFALKAPQPIEPARRGAKWQSHRGIRRPAITEHLVVGSIGSK